MADRRERPVLGGVEAAGFVIDRVDAGEAASIRGLGYRVVAAETLLDDPANAARVAVAALGLAGERAAA